MCYFILFCLSLFYVGSQLLIILLLSCIYVIFLLQIFLCFCLSNVCYDESRCEYLCIYPTWDLLNFLDMYLMSLKTLNSGRCWPFFFSIFFFCPFLYFWTPIIHLLAGLMLFLWSLKLCSFFFNYSFLCSSDWIISISLSSGSIFFPLPYIIWCWAFLV